MFWVHFTGYDVKNILEYHGISLDQHVFFSGTLPAVSYTHLDVYKRQGIGRRRDHPQQRENRNERDDDQEDVSRNQSALDHVLLAFFTLHKCVGFCCISHACHLLSC